MDIRLADRNLRENTFEQDAAKTPFIIWASDVRILSQPCISEFLQSHLRFTLSMLSSDILIVSIVGDATWELDRQNNIFPGTHRPKKYYGA